MKIIPFPSYHRAMTSSEKNTNSVWLKRKSVLSVSVFRFHFLPTTLVFANCDLDILGSLSLLLKASAVLQLVT